MTSAVFLIGGASARIRNRGGGKKSNLLLPMLV
jgi:hypothetical protein